MKASVCLILLAIGLSTSSAQAAFFKCQEPDGTIRYTDQPCATGKEIKLPPITTYTQTRVPSNFSKPGNKDKNTDGEEYQSLTIIEPETGARITAQATATVNIVVKAEPRLRSVKGDVFAIVLDGKQLSSTGVTNTIRLNNVARGNHSAQILILSKNGQLLRTSNTVSFTVGQTTAFDRPDQSRTVTDADGNPELDNDGNTQTETVTNPTAAPRGARLPRPGRATRAP